VDFALDFVALLTGRLLDVAPVLVLLLLLIVGLAILIGRGEGWTLSDSIYFGFVTATTVGYGDFRPERAGGKAMAIVIAYLGLIQIGIIVALAVHAVAAAYDQRRALAPSTMASSRVAPSGQGTLMADPIEAPAMPSPQARAAAGRMDHRHQSPVSWSKV
jgi:hypothetical protein